MLITFAIPAHNEEALLGGTLRAIHTAAAAQVGIEYEIVVADDSSTDGTARVAAEHHARVVSIQARQISAARNAAAKEARGEVLFFVDADTQVTAEAIREALLVLGSGYIGGGGPVRFDGRLPGYARLMLPAMQLVMRVCNLAAGAFLFCTKKAFEAAGGWDPTLFAGEEVALSRALKKTGKFRIIKSPVVTSGRKLRAFTFRELMGPLASLMLAGRKAVKSRERLDLWYGPRVREGSVPFDVRDESGVAGGPGVR